jgi:hypothetical protein
MLARLLRFTFLAQTLIGAMIGTWGAMELAPRWGEASLALVLIGALGWVLLMQWLVIAVSMLHSRPSGPALPWLKAFWGEYKAALLIFGLRLPWTSHAPGMLAPTGQARPGTRCWPLTWSHCSPRLTTTPC